MLKYTRSDGVKASRKKRYYLAYGSNLHIAQMGWRCPDAKIVGTGIIEGYELLYKGSRTGAYLTIEKKEGGKVPVGVWETSWRDERELDKYEGCPTFYYKTEMEIPVKYTSNGKTYKRKCYIYIMHEERKLGRPTNWYIEICKKGYRDFGFDEKILDDALDRSLKGRKANRKKAETANKFNFRFEEDKTNEEK